MIYSLALLLPICFGALISEYAGRMAVYLEGIVNLSSFLFWVFTIYTKNIPLGMILTVLVNTILMYAASEAVEKIKINPFIAGLGINLMISGIIPVISENLFHTKGLVTEVITGTSFFIDSKNLQYGIMIFIFAIILLTVFLLRFSKPGMYLKITGTKDDFLISRGINTKKIRVFSWMAAGFLGSLSGILFTLKFEAFVPNVCSGRGWIALAIVFIGRKSPFGVILATVLYSLLEYIINNASSVFGGVFAGINPTLLLSLPYLIILLSFFIFKKNKD